MHAISLLFAALAIGNHLVAGQTSLPSGCSTNGAVGTTCSSIYQPSSCTGPGDDYACYCRSYRSINSCYVKTCTQTPYLYSYAINYYCSATTSAAPRTGPATVSATATGAINPYSVDWAGFATCAPAADRCVVNVDVPVTCSETACFCPYYTAVVGCITSYCTAYPTELSSALNSVCPSSSGGLSQPAKIGIGVGVGVGGALAAVDVAVLLAKAGVFAGLGAGAAGGAAAGAGGSGAATLGASGAAQGNMTMAGKAGFYGYTPGGEAANFTSPPPGYAPTGGETGAGFSGYGPTGTEGANFTHPGLGPTGTEGANFSAPGTGMGPTGAEGGNFTHPGFGPTGAEGTNFSAPGTGMGPTGTEGTTFSGHSGMGPTGTEGSNFTAPAHPTMGPTGAEGTNFTAPGNPGIGSPGIDGSTFISQPPISPPPNAAYFAAPAAVAPLAAGAAILRRKQVASPAPSSLVSPASPTPSQMQQGRYEPPTVQQGRYEPPNMQHELVRQGVYYGSELGTQEASYMLSRQYDDGHHRPS